jgi:hypothetical protein
MAEPNAAPLPNAQSALAQQLPGAPKKQSHAALVDQWFQDSFHGTPLGNDTTIWNLVFGAKEDLKRRLEKAA